MKQFPSDKTNLAWFKLAECVARGEKERALGVYRLLSHSIPDSAYVLQLEGDLLLAFNDTVAQEKYQAAIALYRKEGRLREAAAVGEHVALLSPLDVELIEQLLEVYQQLGLLDKMCHYCGILTDILLKTKQFEALREKIQSYAQILQQFDRILLYKEVLRRYVAHRNAPEDLGSELLQTVLTLFVEAGLEQEIQRFIAELELLHQGYHQKALAFYR